MTHQVGTEIKKGLTQGTAPATRLGRGGQSLEPNLSHQIKARTEDVAPQSLMVSVCILLPAAPDSPIPPRLAALPALASCSDTAAFPRQLQESPPRAEPKASAPLPDHKGCSSVAGKWKRGNSTSSRFLKQAEGWRKMTQP